MTTSANNSMLAMVQDSIDAKAREAMEYGATEYAHDINAAKKSAENERDSDVKHGAANAQSDTGTGKSSATRIEAGKTNVGAILKTTGRENNPSWTVQDECDYIRACHEKLAANQMHQLEAFLEQGAALIRIKQKLVDETKHETEKAVDRAFGAALKTAGIGADIIPRDARGCYVWIAENKDVVKSFVDDALNASDDSATKEQKSIARKYHSLKLSPYIIKAAMTKETKEAADDTLAKIVDNAIKRADKLGIDRAKLIRAIQSA